MVTKRWPTRSYMRTQKGRPGRGCSSEESFYGGARVDREEALVRGRRSGRGSQRSGRGGAPWWRRTRGGVEEQPKEAATGGVLVEEDDDEELPLPGFASWHRVQVLSVGGTR
jgi:hypothetical protein